MAVLHRRESLTQAVVSALADERGVDETDLEKPLYEVVDPDALDSLFRKGTGRVTFEYLNHTVSVDHEGRVEIDSV